MKKPPTKNRRLNYLLIAGGSMDLTYNGQVIEQRESDGYVNGTTMCQANGEKINNWLRLESTKAYIQELARTTGIPANALCIVKSGSPKFGGGTWLHPLLSLCLARWISAAITRGSVC